VVVFSLAAFGPVHAQAALRDASSEVRRHEQPSAVSADLGRLTANTEIP